MSTFHLINKITSKKDCEMRKQIQETREENSRGEKFQYIL